MTSQLIVSAHLDDAVLSLGSAIAAANREGIRTTVVTLFAGDAPADLERLPAARELHKRFPETLDLLVLRRAEDKAAMELLDCDFIHLEFPDAVYRFDGNGAARCSDLTEIYSAFNADDNAFAFVVGEQLAVVAYDLNPSMIYLPIGIGNHLDHLTARKAGETAFDPKAVRYFEDVPYNTKGTNRSEFIPENRSGNVNIETSGDDVAKGLAALRCYGTQINMLFKDDANWESRISWVDYPLAVWNSNSLKFSDADRGIG